MTITVGEIIALTVVVVVLAVGTVIICVRCWRSISKADEAERAAANLRHNQDRGFHISYVETIRHSFRSLSFRSKKQPPKQVQIPRVHVATVEYLINERSDVHPSYLEKKEGKDKTDMHMDNSPYEPQSDYHILEEAEPSEMEEGDTSSQDIHGIENPVYSVVGGKQVKLEGDIEESMSEHMESPKLGRHDEYSSGQLESDKEKDQSDYPPTSGHMSSSQSCGASSVQTSASRQLQGSSLKCKQGFPSAHFSDQTPTLQFQGNKECKVQQSIPSAHFADQMPQINFLTDQCTVANPEPGSFLEPGEKDGTAFKGLFQHDGDVTIAKVEKKHFYSDSYI